MFKPKRYGIESSSINETGDLRITELVLQDGANEAQPLVIQITAPENGYKDATTREIHRAAVERAMGFLEVVAEKLR